MTANLIAAFLAGDPLTGTKMDDLLETSRRITNLTILNAIGTATVSTSSLVYVSVTGSGQAYTKFGNSAQSDLIAIISLSFFAGVLPAQPTFAISDGTVDYDLTLLGVNTANEHTSAFGAVAITGLAAGAYTLTLRVKNSAANNITMDAGDTYSALFLELSK